MSDFSIKKPQQKPSLDEFLEGANSHQKPTVLVEKKPWEREYDKEEIVKTFLIRIPLDYKEKLDYLSFKTKEPKQKIIEKILFPAIDKKIQQLDGMMK